MESQRGTRGELLTLLLKHKEGMTVDELATAVNLTRNAIRQHLVSMERDGLVVTTSVRRAMGRPSQVYVLTQTGEELFPKRYSWLAEHLLAAVRNSQGLDGTRKLLSAIRDRLVEEHGNQVTGDTLEKRVGQIADVMNQLDYVAAVEKTTNAHIDIRAVNCVYHHLAPHYPEICELDLGLIARLSGGEVRHVQCMARGDGQCVFTVRSKTANPT